MSFTIAFTGDICFHDQPEADFEYSKKILADVMPVFESADLVAMNLENPLAPEGMGEPIPKAGPNLIGGEQTIGFLLAAGCGFAVLANNHTGDFGAEPLYNTLRLLDENGIGYAGAGKNLDEAYKAFRITKNGISLSIVCVCENEFGVAEADKPGTAGFEIGRLTERLVEERDISDFVVVMIHGGNEHNPLPSPMARSRYRLFTELGADAVIGGHPHCPQGIEYYKGKPIVYSTGNFLFKDFGEVDAAWTLGYIAKLTLNKGESPKVEAIPYRFESDGSAINLLKGEEYEIFMRHLDKISAIIPDDRALHDYFDGWCWLHRDFLLQATPGKEMLEFDRHYHNAYLVYNRLICEAHLEICRRLTYIAFYPGLRERAASFVDKIKKLADIGL